MVIDQKLGSTKRLTQDLVEETGKGTWDEEDELKYKVETKKEL